MLALIRSVLENSGAELVIRDEAKFAWWQGVQDQMARERSQKALPSPAIDAEFEEIDADAELEEHSTEGLEDIL